ncbi:MAG: endonuclease III [bacterium]|nr:endonuclease III [bacterium]
MSAASRDLGKPKMLSGKDVGRLIDGLHDAYPDAGCELRHDNPLELLVATILSAQSTDERINLITETLFEKYRTAADFASAEVAVFEQDIRSSGFYRDKTKRVQGMARRLVEEYGGEVPDTMEDLLTLPGVARKTANLVLGTAFGKAEGVVVDTHVRRLSQRLGLSTRKDPNKIEQDLIAALPREEWIFMGHALILHGRRVCKARKPQCDECALADVCPRNGVEVAQ